MPDEKETRSFKVTIVEYSAEHPQGLESVSWGGAETTVSALRFRADQIEKDETEALLSQAELIQLNR